MDITIYRRHSAHCNQKADRYAPRCGCPLWFQLNWKQASTRCVYPTFSYPFCLAFPWHRPGRLGCRLAVKNGGRK